VLNGLGAMQRVVVLGGKSEIAHSVLDQVPMAIDSQVILCGRNMESFNPPEFLLNFHTEKIEIDLTKLDIGYKTIDSIFQSGDVDLVIIAYAKLGNEELQLNPMNFADVMYTNLYSQAILLNYINSKLVDQMHGQILLISSVAGIRPRRRNFVYGASKFGVDFIAQGLQKYNVDKNVFITILRPGFVHTKMTVGLRPAPFSIDLKKISKIAGIALLKKKKIVYAPRFLSIIMFVLRNLPERVFKIFDK
jgi:decaprenylphospho-beta-D-erythro-pentofuranosid-2-ulose 2-reductase